MKKILILICVSCFIIDAFHNVCSKQYISVISDIALVILTLIMGSQYIKKEE